MPRLLLPSGVKLAVWVSPVSTSAKEMLPWVEHPGLDHAVQIAGVAVKMSETPGKVRHRAPLLGEHTDHFLKSIGCSDGDIARLRQTKIVV